MLFICIFFCDYFSAMLTEQLYREALENVASYNSRLCTERRQRLPFIDSQTGVAQKHTNLWIPYRYRGPGTIMCSLLGVDFIENANVMLTKQGGFEIHEIFQFSLSFNLSLRRLCVCRWHCNGEQAIQFWE